MKVYILKHHVDYEGFTIEGVYQDAETVNKLVDEHNANQRKHSMCWASCSVHKVISQYTGELK